MQALYQRAPNLVLQERGPYKTHARSHDVSFPAKYEVRSIQESCLPQVPPRQLQVHKALSLQEPCPYLLHNCASDPFRQSHLSQVSLPVQDLRQGGTSVLKAAHYADWQVPAHYLCVGQRLCCDHHNRLIREI